MPVLKDSEIERNKFMKLIITGVYTTDLYTQTESSYLRLYFTYTMINSSNEYDDYVAYFGLRNVLTFFTHSL